MTNVLTNLVASLITHVVTNTTEIFPHKSIPVPCEHGWPNGISCLAYHTKSIPDLDAKFKTVRTIAKEIIVLKFHWNGDRKIFTEKVLWESNQVMELTTTWTTTDKVIDDPWKGYVNFWNGTNWLKYRYFTNQFSTNPFSR